MSGKKTRKEWAAAYGAPYAVLAAALQGYAVRERLPRRMPGHLFDGETVQTALVQYYAARRNRYLHKAAEINKIINDIRDRGVVE